MPKIKQGPDESLSKFMKRFHRQAVLNSDIEDGVAYTSFLNDLTSGQLKFSLAKQKETTLVEALKRVMDFIRATEIYAKFGDGLRKNRAKERHLTQAERR